MAAACTNPAFVAAGALGFAPFPTLAAGKGDPSDITGNPSNYWAVTSATPHENKDVALAFLKEEVMQLEEFSAGAVRPSVSRASSSSS